MDVGLLLTQLAVRVRLRGLHWPRQVLGLARPNTRGRVAQRNGWRHRRASGSTIDRERDPLIALAALVSLVINSRESVIVGMVVAQPAAVGSVVVDDGRI